MKRAAALLGLWLAGCQDSPAPTAPQIEVRAPGPDLSSPTRFRPQLEVALSAAQVRVGEAVAIAGVATAVLGGPPGWVLVVNPLSTGNGRLEAWYGSGPIATRFLANYPGQVIVEAHALDDRGVPALSRTLLLEVVR